MFGYHSIQKRRYLGGIMILFVLGALLHPATTRAVTDTFTVQQQIGDVDVNSPTAPGNLAAVGVATTQINLSWDASTDDYTVGGYRVWRDGVHIATTTSLAYSDTGLLPSTMYSYYITAFDTSLNESASSTVASATTLAVPPEPPPPVSGSSQTGTRVPNFKDMVHTLAVYPDTYTARLSFTTTEHVRAVVRWGRTPSYEMGSLRESIFATTHETLVEGLAPATRYYFTIEGENRFGQYGVLFAGTFITQLLEDTSPPGNVTSLHAETHPQGVALSWQNPLDDDFAKVRIIANDLFYPSDVADGWVVYEGNAEVALDTRPADGAVRYYTAFTYDALGNVSSGAVARYVWQTGATGVEPADPSKNVLELTYSDVRVIQDGIPILWDDSATVIIDGTKEFSVALPYDALPEHLKTIVVTIERTVDGAVEYFSFLLRVNSVRSAYVATVAPLGERGSFPIQISVFDFKTMQIGYVGGALESHIMFEGAEVAKTHSFFLILRQPYIYVVLLCVLLFFFLRRRRAEPSV